MVSRYRRASRRRVAGRPRRAARRLRAAPGGRRPAIRRALPADARLPRRPGAGLPCTVDRPRRGFVLIKDDDPTKPFAWLLVPSTDVTGIEDPAVLRGAGRRLLGDRLGSSAASSCRRRRRGGPRDQLDGRAEPEPAPHPRLLHPARLRAALAAADIGPDWRAAPFLTLGGQRFNARRWRGSSRAPSCCSATSPGGRGHGRAVARRHRARRRRLLPRHRLDGPGVAAETEALLDETCAPGRLLSA